MASMSFSTIATSLEGEEVECCYTDLAMYSRKFDADKMSNEELDKLKMRLEKAIPKISRSNVAASSFVGLDEAKEDVVESIECNYKPLERILLYGPNGSGKSHFARVLSTQLNALLFTIDKTIFHGWANNLELFTKIFAEIAGASGDENGNGRVVLLLENFDWFFETEEEMSSVAGLLNTVQSCWTKNSCSKLTIIACSYKPWGLDKKVIGSFEKMVYLRPLNFQERKQLIQKKSGEWLQQWGLDMTDGELGQVAKRAERFASWELSDCVEKTFMLQCPVNVKWNFDPRPLTKVDFEVILDEMLAGGNGRECLKKYNEFNRNPGGMAIMPGAPTFDAKGIQVEMIKKKKKNRNFISKMFAQIVL